MFLLAPFLLCKWTKPLVFLAKTFKIEKYFLMYSFILLLHLKTFKIKSKFVVCSIPCLCIVKNGQKWPCSWGRESRKEWCHSHQFFSVDSYDLKSLSFKFRNDTFITFEMQRVAYKRPFWKIYNSLLFRPFASEVLALFQSGESIITTTLLLIHRDFLTFLRLCLVVHFRGPVDFMATKNIMISNAHVLLM